MARFSEVLGLDLGVVTPLKKPLPVVVPRPAVNTRATVVTQLQKKTEPVAAPARPPMNVRAVSVVASRPVAVQQVRPTTALTSPAAVPAFTEVSVIKPASAAPVAPPKKALIQSVVTKAPAVMASRDAAPPPSIKATIVAQSAAAMPTVTSVRASGSPSMTSGPAVSTLKLNESSIQTANQTVTQLPLQLQVPGLEFAKSTSSADPGTQTGNTSSGTDGSCSPAQLSAGYTTDPRAPGVCIAPGGRVDSTTGKIVFPSTDSGKGSGSSGGGGGGGGGGGVTTSSDTGTSTTTYADTGAGAGPQQVVPSRAGPEIVGTKKPETVAMSKGLWWGLGGLAALGIGWAVVKRRQAR